MPNEKVPSWIGRVIVTALITALVGGALAWGGNTSKKVGEHDRDLAVQKESQKNIVGDIDEIRASQRRVEDKLDRALERRQ